MPTETNEPKDDEIVDAPEADEDVDVADDEDTDDSK